jgi:hypothetical protein
MQFPLPPDYIEFLLKNGTVECFTSEEPGYIQFWSVEELDKINSEIETELNARATLGLLRMVAER